MLKRLLIFFFLMPIEYFSFQDTSEGDMIVEIGDMIVALRYNSTKNDL